MSVTRDDIQDWFEVSRALEFTHMLIVCDTYSYDNYPVYVRGLNDFLNKFFDHHGKNMQRVEEVYDLSMDMVDQLNEESAWHLPEGFADRKEDEDA